MSTEHFRAQGGGEPALQAPGGLAIGVTGGIGCGKSAVGRILAEAGVQVRDADQIAHQVIAPDGAAYAAVRERFGASICTADGHIDRRALGERVFADQAEREALNRIVHPFVRRIWRGWMTSVLQADGVAAIVVPLLFEVKADKDVQVVIGVVASPDAIYERLAKRGLSREQADQRIAAQMAVDEKMRRSDYVIENKGTLQDLENATRAVLHTILEKERDRHG